MDNFAISEIEYLKGLEGVVTELNSFCSNTGEFKCTVLFYLLKLELLNVKDLDTFNSIEVLWDSKSGFYSVNAHGLESTIFKSRNTFPSEFCGFEQGDVPTVTLAENLEDIETDDNLIGYDTSTENTANIEQNTDERTLPVVSQQGNTVAAIASEHNDKSENKANPALNNVIIKEEPDGSHTFVIESFGESETKSTNCDDSLRIIAENSNVSEVHLLMTENDVTDEPSELIAKEVVKENENNQEEIPLVSTADSRVTTSFLDESAVNGIVKTSSGTLKVTTQFSENNMATKTTESLASSNRAPTPPRQIIVKEKNLVPSYPCLSCEKSFMLFHQLKRHQKTHLTDKIYKCDICNKGFNDENNLRVHRKNQHENKKWTCSTCKKGYATEDKLLAHEKMHKRATRLKCDVCEQKFNSLKGLKEHKLQHQTPKNKYTCEVCGWNFSVKSILNFHYKQFHPEVWELRPKKAKGKSENLDTLETVKDASKDGISSAMENSGALHSLIEEDSEVINLDLKIKEETDDSDRQNTTNVELSNKTRPELKHSSPVIRNLRIRAKHNKPHRFKDFVTYESKENEHHKTSKDTSTTEQEEQFSGSDAEYVTDKEDILAAVSSDDEHNGVPKKKRKLERSFPGKRPTKKLTVDYWHKGILRKSTSKTRHRGSISKQEDSMKNEEKVIEFSEDGANIVNDVIKENQDPLAKSGINEYFELDIKHIHKCLFCTDEFKNMEEYEHHVSNEHNENEIPYLCSICPKTFYSRKKIRNHLYSVHMSVVKKTCDICYETFDKKVEFKKHMKSHNHSEVICEECGKTFTTLKALHTHQKSHSELLRIKCEHCEREFTTKKALEFHKKCHQSSVPLPLCEYCGMEVESRKQLRAHLRKCPVQKTAGEDMENTKGTKEDKSAYRSYQCAFCEASFLHKRSLLVHMNDNHEHTEEILFPCSHCKKAFSTIAQLKRHVRTHGLGGPESFFHCEVCARPFTDKGNLNKHMVVHTGIKKYQCDICGKHFTTSGGLINHKNTHLNYRPYKCSYCIKSFTNKSALKGHERIHTGETPYVCDICGWKFKDKSHLNRHNKSHLRSDSVRPYRCHTQKCGKLFTSLELLNKHIATSHIKVEEGVKILQGYTEEIYTS